MFPEHAGFVVAAQVEQEMTHEQRGLPARVACVLAGEQGRQ